MSDQGQPRWKPKQNAPKAAPGSAPPPPPPADTVLAEPEDWHPMESAPKDGSYIFLFGDPYDSKSEIPNEWYWYRTRQFRKGSWQPVGWWRRRFGTSVPPSFTPQGWRAVREGLPHD